tara:strand:- start:4213 stop:5229 length:1017 start_codon:yes stop_codon:yes gene_type:complete
MANKKISQLVGLSSNETVSGNYLYPVGAGGAGGPWTTQKVTSNQIANYIFTGDSAGGGFPAMHLSGQGKAIYFNNAAVGVGTQLWEDTSASADGYNYGYVMVRRSDGLLTTGSGIAAPVGGDNLGNHKATQTLDMQDKSIQAVGPLISFQDGGGNIGCDASELELLHDVKIKLDSPRIQIGASDLSIVSGDFLAKSAGFVGTVTGASLEVQGASYHNVTDIGASTAAGAINVDWTDGNIQHQQIGANTTFTFVAGTPAPGQTLTMYVENIQGSFNDKRTVDFKSGAATDKVLWSDHNKTLPHASAAGCPGVSGARTNVYTFVVMNEKIFASAVTGYDY